MKECLICGMEIEKGEGIYYDGYWFDDVECVNVYCAFTGKEYEPQPQNIKEAA